MIGATEHISGYSIEEIKEQKCWRFLVVEEDMALFEKNVIDLAPGSHGFCELRIHHKNGGIVWIASYAECFIDKESPEHFILYGALVDITEHKQADAQLLESEERYRSLVENAQEGIFQTTPEGKFRMANQAMATILGYASPRELMESVTDIKRQIYVNPQDRIRILETLDIHKIIRKGELQFYRKDGSVIWVFGNIQSVGDKNGEVLYYEGIIEDITDRKKNADQLRKALGGTVQAIASLAESRDPYTAGHQRRVAELAAAIAGEMGLSPEQIEGLSMAGIIHDIGKVSVPADILNMPRKLSVIEYDLVKTHVQSGYDIVKDIEFPWPVARMILEHHERIDGSGYPNGLTGDELLLESRIMAVADVVEAMVSHRPYRPALGVDAALEEIAGKKGICYDSAIVDFCLRLFREKGYAFKEHAGPSLSI
jgi:PAS domain S-box-containing protein/putative nucleotidyltransferase with HDIG domain